MTRTTEKLLIIDPPSGWRYGFPKPIPRDQLDRSKEWLVENGYPQIEIDALGDHFYYRFWEHDPNKDTIQAPPMQPSRREDHFLDIKGAAGVGIVMGLIMTVFMESTLGIMIPEMIQVGTVAAAILITYWWLLRRKK